MPNESLTLRSRSPHETESLGRKLMVLLPDGALVALRGNLGAGKTCFVRGMAEAVEATERVTSPTFTIVHEYHGIRPIWHVDLYRIHSDSEVHDLGHDQLFSPPAGVCVVEWAERAEALLPDKRVDLEFVHDASDRRIVTVIDRGVLPEGWQEILREGTETCDRPA